MEFEVGENEHVDIGDVPARPLPIQFLGLQRCDTIPSQGGTCSFSVDVRNGRDRRFRGEVWARVVAFDLDSLVGFSEFQIGKTGPRNPTPQQFNLSSGQSLRARFQFDVPGHVPSHSFFCVQAVAGEDPTPQFDTLGLRRLFCAGKESGGFRVLSNKEARKLMSKVGWLPEN